MSIKYRILVVALCLSGWVYGQVSNVLPSSMKPIVFLKELSQYPLAVALASVPPGDPNVQLVCCVLAALPPLLLFALFNREMAEGIELGGSKMI